MFNISFNHTQFNYRAGYLEVGVSRIVDQVVEQKMSYIQSKVEEILYQYVGIAKPIKKEKLPTETLEVETDLLPTDLEQVSPDSDKKSLPEDMDIDESKGEEIEEEIVEDEDFESPAFEPIEPATVAKNENSNLSAISGLTSQDSLEDKNDLSLTEPQQETQLSQISSVQDMSQEAIDLPVTVEKPDEMTTPEISVTEAQAEQAEPQPEVQEIAKDEPEEISNFDLKKDSIEFTGTERKSISLDDSQSTTEPEKVLQPQDVPSNTMEIDNLYENDTTDSSEARMEIDLKDETTQGSVSKDFESAKIEESSQDSTVSKEKPQSDSKKDSRHHHKSDRSKDNHKSSSSHKSRHHHRSSSSRSHRDDKHKRSDGKSSSSSHKKSSSDKDRSSSSRRDHDKDKKSSRDESSKSKHREHKSDDHHQEKSSRKRRSTDHDSNEGKTDKLNLSAPADSKSDRNKNDDSTITKAADDPQQMQETTENTSVKLDSVLNENCEVSFDSRSSTSSSTKKEPKSSILVKYDYLKGAQKPVKAEAIEDGFCGFVAEKLPENPWFECLRKETKKKTLKKANQRASYVIDAEQRKLDKPLSVQIPKTKAKPKAKQNDSPSHPTDAAKLQNGSEETSSEAQSIAQQQRYNTEDLYKPRFDFGNRNRRRGQATEDISDEPQVSKIEAPAI